MTKPRAINKDRWKEDICLYFDWIPCIKRTRDCGECHRFYIRKQVLEEVRDWVILMMPSEIIVDDARGITGVGSLRELKERLEQKIKAME